MPSYPIPDGPHNDIWKQLLEPCFAVIDAVVAERGVPFPIQIGGGSMLLRRYGHRKSKDLDLFVTDTRLVRWCSPRFNEVAADLFPDYGEEATAVSLIWGMQEIDIIAVAPVILDEATESAVLGGRQVLVERPREILAKKVAYRGRLFQPRDVFDLACVASAEPEEVAAVLPWLSLTHVADLDARLDEIEPNLGVELAAKVDSYPEFETVREFCLDIVRGVVRTWRENLTPGVEAPPHPPGYRALYSRDGRSVVIKELNHATGRCETIGNTLGPAAVGADGANKWFIGGEQLTREEWRRHPDVVAALGPKADYS